jgi:hypothetical protein
MRRLSGIIMTDIMVDKPVMVTESASSALKMEHHPMRAEYKSKTQTIRRTKALNIN